MRVQLESTERTIELRFEPGGPVVPARIWKGTSEAGVPVVAFITRIAAEVGHDLTEFERELQHHAAPTPDLAAWPARMVV